MKKVLLITEILNPPFDEGIKKTVFDLFKILDDKYETQVICRKGFLQNNIHILKVNKLFLSLKVKKIIDIFKPDVIIYFPFQSSTFASYLRLNVFSLFSISSKKILFALQPKKISRLQLFFLNFLKPDFALTPSPDLSKFWSSVKIKHSILPLSCNTKVFTSVPFDKKINLRKKYGLDKNIFIVSHMGHLVNERNLDSLILLQEAGFQVLIVSSTSTPDGVDVGLKSKLISNGIIIFDFYIENIHEVYQLSDVYVFPVMNKNSSIGLPLSILEARSCGIPVVTTDFGSVKLFMKNDYSGIRYSHPNNFLSHCNYFKSSTSSYSKSSIDKINNIFADIIKREI